MNVAARKVITALERTVPLEWYRCSGPLVVWRYDGGKATADRIATAASAAQQIVASFRGNEEWIIEVSGRNWVLVPKRVKELERTGQFKVDVEILKYLTEQDPGFARKTDSDLERLAGVLGGP